MKILSLKSIAKSAKARLKETQRVVRPYLASLCTAIGAAGVAWRDLSQRLRDKLKTRWRRGQNEKELKKTLGF